LLTANRLNLRRILVVQIADIGDLILSTPALAALREAYPQAQITVMTTAHSAPILRGTNLADSIITVSARLKPRELLHPVRGLKALAGALRLGSELRRGRYDAVIFLHQLTTPAGALKYAAIAYATASPIRAGLENGRGFFLTHHAADRGFGARHQAQYWLDGVGLLGADSAPRPAQVGISDDDRSWVREHLPPAVSRIAVHAGSGGYSLARRWEAERFAEVADRLADQYNAQIVVVGGKQDDNDKLIAALRHPAVDLTGKTTLNQLAAVLESCNLFIGADSGVMHLAASAGAPLAAIFGPSNHQAWHPWMPTRAQVVRSGVECSPCSYVGGGIGARNGCAARTCMRLVTVEQVAAAGRELLDTPSREHRPAFGAHHAPLKEGEQRVDTLNILGFPVSAVTYEQWLALIGEWVRGSQPRHVCTINPEMIMIARQDPIFAAVLRRADLTVPDGVGLLWAARVQGRPLPARVTGSDGVPIIAERAAREGWRLFLLGAAPGVADKAAETLRERFTGVQIVGVYSGSPAPAEEDAIVERVNAAGADILFVAYGAPEQDKWIARNLPRLNVKMAMGVGGSFDFLAGIIPRAPLAWQRAGLEWLYRLYLQPWRIRRMLRLPRFAAAVLLEKVANGDIRKHPV
jgi:N-acetylglucosaminyldiphosphoundecaprenol N-acetyl-beta-D-mannosaminyltransferase